MIGISFMSAHPLALLGTASYQSAAAKWFSPMEPATPHVEAHREYCQPQGCKQSPIDQPIWHCLG
jgi:hypothetical protein